MDLTNHLTTEEAAKVVGLSVPTLITLCHHQRGPRRIKLGRRLYFTKADLEAWTAARAVVIPMGSKTGTPQDNSTRNRRKAEAVTA